MLVKERFYKPGLAGVLLLTLSSVPALAGEGARGTYVSVFGGGGIASSSDVTQSGTVFFTEAEGGPLAVRAKGQTDSRAVGLVGLQVGHEWSLGPASGVLPALELEGFYLGGGTRRAKLNNPTDRLPEHRFDDSFPMKNAVFLANVVLSFPTSYRGVTPYVGAGIGAARMSVDGADSATVSPAEPGINHFNSGADSSAWGFAAQAKAGVRVALGTNAYVFGEYRYLFVDTADQIFGSTVYPTHAPSTDWRVRFGNMSHHLGAGGIGFNF